MIRDFFSLYTPSYVTTLVYMLQSVEYEALPYVRWYWRTRNFSRVAQRRKLHFTRAAHLLLLAIRIGIVAQIVIGFTLIYLGLGQQVTGVAGFGVAIIIIYPVLWAHLLIVPLALGRLFIVNPREKKIIQHSERLFLQHSGIKIAVVGSYGKTSMKELLLTVLGETKKVAATPANKNVSISHARFIQTLSGDEDVLIIEYGEGKPGDVAQLATITHPNHAVITGLAPAHLDSYKTLQAAGEDIFSIANFVDSERVYVNGDSPSTEPFIQPNYAVFSEKCALDWKVSDITITHSDTRLTLKKGKQTLHLKSGLIGRHQVGFLAFAAAFALQLGLTKKQVEAAISKTKPFEHRMYPYSLGGAWIIDDTYNGNLEGIRAGTQLLHELKARRKLYVTPGLVEQGEETEQVHRQMGELIAAAQPDIVVLMQNSVTTYIHEGLKAAGFAGEVRLESHPLEFYTNLKHLVATGDLVMMQNDWTDNYH